MTTQGPQPPRPGKPAGAPKPKQAIKSAKKPAARPGDGFLGWLGRQVGHVKKAVNADVTKPANRQAAGAASSGGAAKPKPAKPADPQAAARPQGPQVQSAQSKAAPAGSPPPSPTVIYRNDKIEEAELPDRPGMKLRRTIIDEVIVEKKKE